MSLVPSLLHAIVQADGEAMVMHAGDKPYVVSPTGQVELASRGLTLEAVNGIVAQLLPHDIQMALDEFGAIQYELPPASQFPDEHFTVVAARGGDDLWIEVRRRRAPDDHVPEEVVTHASPRHSMAQALEPQPHEPQPPVPVSSAPSAATPTASAPAPVSASIAFNEAMRLESPPLSEHALPPRTEPSPTDLDAGCTPALSTPAAVADEPSMEIDLNELDDVDIDVGCPTEAVADTESYADEPVRMDDEMAAPGAAQLWPAHSASEDAPEVLATHLLAEGRTDLPCDASGISGLEEETVDAISPGELDATPEPLEIGASIASEPTSNEPTPSEPTSKEPTMSEPVSSEPTSNEPTLTGSTPVSSTIVPAEPDASRGAAAAPSAPQVLTPLEPAASSKPWPVAKEQAPVEVEPTPAVVLPIARSPIRPEPPPLSQESGLSGLERLLRLSAARGASALYLWSKSRPSVRVDGELQMLEGEPLLSARDVESLLLTLVPDRSHEALRTGALVEWICELEGVGRIRCVSFRDRHGPGGVFRLMPTRSVSVEQLGLPKHVQALATEPEGLVLVAGPRSSGKRTLIAALVDLMNRTRRDHIITIEREINIVHERGSAFISQREIPGDDDQIAAAARGAMREDPDVLVIEELRPGRLMNVALEAAASGRLVIGGFSAHSAAGAIDRINEFCVPEHRRQIQFSVAESLRGIVAQQLLRKIGGGRVPAREVLLNTPAVASLIADGNTSQLPMALEGARRYGMSPMNDALVSLVHSGAVEAREAYRRSPDRAAFLAALDGQGIDTSFAERFA